MRPQVQEAEVAPLTSRARLQLVHRTQFTGGNGLAHDHSAAFYFCNLLKTEWSPINLAFIISKLRG